MSVELQDVSEGQTLARRTDDESDDVTQQHLPPVDGGPGAWKYLFASFVIEAVLWGMISTITLKLSITL